MHQLGLYGPNKKTGGGAIRAASVCRHVGDICDPHKKKKQAVVLSVLLLLVGDICDPHPDNASLCGTASPARLDLWGMCVSVSVSVSVSVCLSLTECLSV